MDDSPSKLAQHPALAEMQIITLKADKAKLQAELHGVLAAAEVASILGHSEWNSIAASIRETLEQTK